MILPHLSLKNPTFSYLIYEITVIPLKRNLFLTPSLQVYLKSFASENRLQIKRFFDFLLRRKFEASAMRHK